MARLRVLRYTVELFQMWKSNGGHGALAQELAVICVSIAVVFDNAHSLSHTHTHTDTHTYLRIHTHTHTHYTHNIV